MANYEQLASNTPVVMFLPDVDPVTMKNILCKHVVADYESVGGKKN